MRECNIFSLGEMLSHGNVIFLYHFSIIFNPFPSSSWLVINPFNAYVWDFCSSCFPLYVLSILYEFLIKHRKRIIILHLFLKNELIFQLLQVKYHFLRDTIAKDPWSGCSRIFLWGFIKSKYSYPQNISKAHIILSKNQCFIIYYKSVAEASLEVHLVGVTSDIYATRLCFRNKTTMAVELMKE